MFRYNNEVLAPPPLDIVLDAGGDHQFDLGHLRRQGALRLVRLLLQTAGYRKRLRWHVRVEKKFGCGPETKPVTVVGAKPWCCYIKIKPGDNNTAHFCSLLVPDGLKGEQVYQALKDVEDRVNRAYRAGFEGEVAPMDEPEPPKATPDYEKRWEALQQAAQAEQEAADQDSDTNEQDDQEVAHSDEDEAPDSPQEPESPRPAVAATVAASSSQPDDEEEGTPSELLGWTNDMEKVRLTLWAIHEAGVEGKARNLDEFVAALSEKLSWQNLRRKQIGGIFTALVRRGNIQRLRHGSTPLGYALTEDGKRIIEDILNAETQAKQHAAPAPSTPAPAPVPVPAPTPTPVPQLPSFTLPLPLPGGSSRDRGHVAITLAELARRYADASKKLEEIRVRRVQLMSEVEKLDAEAAALNRMVANTEVDSLVDKLLQALNGGR